MKKWKLLFISIAVVVGIGGAFASNYDYNRRSICGYYNQFHFTNGAYVDVGEEDVDYACVGGAGICTYYKPYPNGPYLACHYGIFQPIYEINGKKK